MKKILGINMLTGERRYRTDASMPARKPVHQPTRLKAAPAAPKLSAALRQAPKNGGR